MTLEAKEFWQGIGLVLLLFVVMWICFAAFPEGFYK